MKMSKKKLDPSLRAEALKLLTAKLNGISSSLEMNKFLSAFFTDAEEELMLKKAAILTLLSKGIKYRDICELLGVSKNTISHLQKVLSGKAYKTQPVRKPQTYHAFDKRKKKKYSLRYKGAIPFGF